MSTQPRGGSDRRPSLPSVVSTILRFDQTFFFWPSFQSGRYVERRSSGNLIRVGLTIDDAEFPGFLEYRLKLGCGEMRVQRGLISPGFDQAERASGTYFFRNVEKDAASRSLAALAMREAISWNAATSPGWMRYVA